MELTKNQLFDNRYQLVKMLGAGASAEVWLAKDTKANNLKVALKIFKDHSELDTYGMQDFEREFTTVYNMKQSNLLPPTGYDIYEGRPYLITQYCENGSCNGLAGKMDENDIIKLLHDVAAGLEYLHDHNIIHQDIKPDNILLDDNCNYLVTDFGISVGENDGKGEYEGMSGGTRAYMGPERFEGTTNNASDIWALGATAVELLTGEPPYGDHGGLLQAEGEPLPELPKLSPEVKSIILRCLEKDPAKRITASEIRSKIDLFWETGSWKIHSHKKLIALIATSVASLVICAGIFFWDYNRTKVRYYKDYKEVWGIPEGIGRLSANEMSHRDITYKMEFRQRKLRRLSLVNSVGNVVSHRDTERTSSRYSDVKYYYTDSGNIDYKIVSDHTGKTLFKMDYDENLKTVTFRRNDEYGTEFNFSASKNQLHNSGGSIFDEKSRISRYLLSYNENGQLIELHYAGLQNIPACDDNSIYGERFKYDEKGHIVEKEYLGADGNTTTNRNGLAIRVFTYDEDDNWTSVTYLNAERNGSHDGQNCSLVKLEYDEWGNRIKEMYYTFEGEPAIRTDFNVSGFSYTHTPQGFRESLTCLDLEGKPTFCQQGYVTCKDSFNDNGFIVKRTFLDDSDMPANYMEDDYNYSYFERTPNEMDQNVEIKYFDKDGRPAMQPDGSWRIAFEYDNRGNNSKLSFFDDNNKPAKIDGFYHGYALEYDSLDNLVHQYYFDDKGNITTSDGTIAELRMEYNRQGAMTKYQNFDVKHNLVDNMSLFAAVTIEYDEMGNRKTYAYLDKNGKLTKPRDDEAKTEYVYDQKTNFLTSLKYYNTDGKLIRTAYQKYDGRGNVIEDYSLVDGKLMPGSVVTKRTYDANNKETEEYYCDLNGKRVNGKNGYSKVKYEYDKKGNCTTLTFWSTDDKPANDEYKSHKRVREFDNMNRVIVEKYLDVNGKPITGSQVNPEGRVKYDKWGNLTELSCFDGYGKPQLTTDGYHRMVYVYDYHRKIQKIEYYGVDGKLIVSKSGGYAKAEYTYDNHGNRTEAKFYDTNKCIIIETTKFNDHGKDTETIYYDGNRKQSDANRGYSKVTVEYEEDGVTPKLMKWFDAKGTQLAKSSYNSKTKEWNELVYAQSMQAAPAQSYSTGWQSTVRNDASNCPMKLTDGVYLQTVTYSGNSVRATIKLSEKSLYDTENTDVDNIKSVAREIKPILRKAWGLPSNVSFTIVMVDKAGRNICTV